jgi:hypothetical protein
MKIMELSQEEIAKAYERYSFFGNQCKDQLDILKNVKPYYLMFE